MTECLWAQSAAPQCGNTLCENGEGVNDSGLWVFSSTVGNQSNRIVPSSRSDRPRPCHCREPGDAGGSVFNGRILISY